MIFGQDLFAGSTFASPPAGLVINYLWFRVCPPAQTWTKITNPNAIRNIVKRCK